MAKLRVDEDVFVVDSFACRSVAENSLTSRDSTSVPIVEPVYLSSLKIPFSSDPVFSSQQHEQ